MNTQRRRGFTLIEMLIVIAIIAILSALIFPSFSAAREDARQKACSSNLREIGLAVQMYRIEEREYPMSLGALLPPSVRLNNASTNSNASANVTTPATAIDGDVCGTDTATSTCTNAGGTGYLRDKKYLLCPNDGSLITQPRSSYGDLSTGIPNLALPTATPATPEDLSRRTWNFWGLRDDGVAYANSDVPAALYPIGDSLLVDATRKYVAPDTAYDAVSAPNAEDYRTNVVKSSLSNRFAPSSTIITYCAYHRPYSSSVSSPEKLYDPAEVGKTNGARDLILRVDGTVNSVVVSAWRSAGAVDTTANTDPNYKMWQIQTFR